MRAICTVYLVEYTPTVYVFYANNIVFLILRRMSFYLSSLRIEHPRVACLIPANRITLLDRCCTNRDGKISCCIKCDLIRAFCRC